MTSEYTSSPPSTPISEAVLIVNARGNIRFAAPLAAQYPGEAANDLVGRSILSFVVPEEIPRVQARWQSFLQDPELASDELTFPAVLVEGRQIPVRAAIWRLPGRGEFLVITHAAALHDARQSEDGVSRAERLQALNEVSLAISHLDLDSMIEMVYQKVSRLMDASTFYVGLYDAETEQVRITGEYQRGQKQEDVFQGANQGLVGAVLRSRQSLVIQDSQAEGLSPGMILRGDVPRSLLMFPLVAQNAIVGLMSVQSPRPNAYSPDDITLLETIAGTVAVAVQNVQFYDETAARLATLQTLHRIGLELAAIQNAEGIARLILQAVIKLFHPPQARLYLVGQTPADDQLWIAYDTGEPDQPHIQVESDPGLDDLMAQVLESNQPVILPDLSDQIEVQTALLRSWLVQAATGYPILYGGQPLGVLTLLYSGPRHFHSDTLRALELLCMQAATALKTVRLFGETRERAAQLAEANANLKALDHLRNELIQNVSHELRSPLALVRGYISLILEGEWGAIAPEIAETLVTIDQKTESVTRLINDILSLETIRRETLELKPVDLNSLCERIVAGARLVHQVRGIVFETDLTTEQVIVVGDRDRLNQVLDNLIGNAAKFSHEGGTVQVRTQVDTFGGRALVSVIDHGIGIPEEQLPRIFERFYQGSEAIKKHYGGAGLGLSIVQRIVEAHAGAVWVESKEGEGSIFTFALPLAERE